ncbi:MAG: ATP synthase F1 subunit delta [Desulfohalobiaceae bacterium]
MREQIIAKRYARALFAIGQDKGDEELNKYGQELAALAELLQAYPQLVRIFKNPIIKAQEKKTILAQIMEKGELGPVVRNFCNFLADKERLGSFLAIQEYYQTLLDQKEGILRGKLITAIELTKARQDKTTKDLEERLQQKLVLHYETNQKILGGVVLEVGDKVYDASLRAQLDRLKENIKRGE